MESRDISCFSLCNALPVCSPLAVRVSYHRLNQIHLRAGSRKVKAAHAPISAKACARSVGMGGEGRGNVVTKATDGEGEVRRAISARQMATGKGFTALECILGVGRSWWVLRRKSNEESYGKKGLWDCGKGERGKGCVMERSLHRKGKSSLH